MKSFKLKALQIVKSKKTDIYQQNIALIDGLVINREDDKEQWLIEAYVNQDYTELFKNLFDKEEEVMIQVKITTENNEPATFITSVVGVNKINHHINILFLGTLVDYHKEIIEKKLTMLINQGYTGEELLQKFKEEV